MAQSAHVSYDSLPPNEFDKLVLSPPASVVSPEKLKNLLSINRTVSAKCSLHLVKPSESTQLALRRASVAWSQCEFDSKFKQHESEMKLPNTSEALQSVHLKRISLNLTNDSEHATASIDIGSSGSLITSTRKSSQIFGSSTGGWWRLLCCVPSCSHRPRFALILGRGESTHTSSEVALDATATKISKYSKWFGIFKKQKGFTGFTKTTARLRSVCRSPQLVGNHLKSPAPTRLFAPHEVAVTVPAESDPTHPEEDGFSGYHVTLDDSMLGSFHSQDRLRDDDSYLESIDQGNPNDNLLGQPSPDSVGKKCLVLDLDETLVHSSFKPVESADFTVTVEIENIQHEVSVCMRPHLETFIEAIGPLFEVVIFTASLSKYADPVCDRIDPEGYFKHRLFRESCVYFKSNYIKHLAVLGRDIEQICIIDNSPISFYFHRQNALQIVTWFDDPTDTALLDLIPYLKGLAEASSVLEYVSQHTPPPSAAIALPDFSPWLFSAPGLYEIAGWGGYDDDDEEDIDVFRTGCHTAQQGYEEGAALSSPHGIITAAPRSTAEAFAVT